MAAWTPPKEDEIGKPISETETPTWKPPETDIVQNEWAPPREDDPDDPINIKDPWKISQLKESGQPVSDEQERILFDYEDEKPLTQKAGDFIGGALEKAPEAFADIAVGGAQLGYKGVLLPLNEMFLGFAMYTPEQRAKILRDRDLTYKALASGGAQGLDEAMEAGTRLATLGSSITDKLQGMPKEERFRRYMTRETMRKFAQAARAETPDTLARLTAESPLIRGIVKTMVDMEGGDPKAQEEAVKEYERLVKESGMTKEELDEFAKVVNFGDVSMPTALPGANTLTKAVSKPIVAATQKGGELALKGLNLGSRATGWTAGKVIGAGEYIQKKARDIGEYAVNDPDTFLKGAVNTAMLPVMTVVKPTKTVADVITDITRQVDVGGAAGRRGMFERAGRDVRSTATTQKLFGPEGKGGVGRAKLADWAVRQSNAMIQPGVNAGALNVLMGLPDAETAEQAGQQFGTGFGIGAYSGSRAESRVLGMVDPRTTMAQKVTNLVTPDPTQLRRDQDADIKRFMATASPDLRQQMQDLASIDKRKAALDQAIAEATDVQSRTIDKETSDFLQIQIDGYNKQKAALDKATPETQREYDRLIQLTTLDALDQAQAVGTAAGLRGMNLVFLDPANAEQFYRNLYGQTLVDAEKNKAILTGRALTPEEQNTLREANETLAAFAQRVDNAQNTRGFALSEPITDANDPEYVPPHLRMQNQKGATAVINTDLVKHLTERGFNVRHTIQHEVQHALENFKEVQDLLSPVRKYLFDQKVQNDDGTFTVVSEGAYNDQKLDEYAMQYAQKFSPADGGAGFFAQFGGDIQKQRDYIKREILAEVATAGGEYEGGSRAALDDVGRNFVDWLEVTTRDGFLKKMKEGLRKVGVVVDNTGGYTTLFDAKITPEVVATIRQYQRGLRDMNGALTYNAKREAEEPDIPLVKILGNRALQEKYKNADFFEKEQIVRATQPDGSQTEIVVPEGANLDSFTGIYRVENGQLVDEDGTPMQLAPEINVQAMPNGTKFEVDTRIARKPDGSPIIIQNREMKRRAIDRTQMLVNAIESAPKDDSPFRMIDVGKGDYRGAMSPSQVEALLKIPNTVLSPNLKRMIVFFNEILRRGDGTRVMMEYQAALLNGKYKAIAPRLRDEVPIGFKITKDGNFTVTTMSVSRMYDKMNAWAAKKPLNLSLWGGDTGKFWDSVIKVLDNHARGEKGEVGLHPDPYIALRMKYKVNDLFNVYNAETKAANPDRTTLPREKGKDPVDVIVRSRRLDRINNFSEISAQKLPMNYGKLLENYLPANNPLARPQSPDEMMMNLDGSVTATRIRNAIASGNVEQLESELRASDDLLPFESLYVSQGETGEPQIQVVSMLEPGIEPSLEPSEIPRDIDAETEAEIAKLDAEQDMVEQAQQGQLEQQQGQQGQQVPRVRAEFIPPVQKQNTYYSARQPGTEQYAGSFFTPDREAANQFGENFGLPVSEFQINPKNIASDIDVEIVANELGIYKKGTPVDQYLIQGPDAIFEESSEVVRRLRKQGFDSVELFDGISKEPSLVVLNPEIIQKNAIADSGISYLPAEDPFYSRLQRGIQESQQATYSPDQAKALARKSTNAEELKWSGIENAIDSIAEENNGKVPKQALLDYMANEGQVKFEETNLAELNRSEEIAKKYGITLEITPEEVVAFDKDDESLEWDEFPEELKQELLRTQNMQASKYAKYQLPGGENYREIVLTMPEGNRGKWNDFDAWLKGRVGSKRAKVLTEKERNDFKKEWRDLNPAENDYTSSHYSNIPNYVAHIRLNERKDAEGKEGLFIEEIQSDRHQQGRKYGYDSDIPKFDPTKLKVEKAPAGGYTAYNVYYDGVLVAQPPSFAAKNENDAARIGRETVERGLTLNRQGKTPIPDAPFRKDWPLQMFKRALRDAVAGGKEWIGWTDGATQADRYDLSKQVDAIQIEKVNENSFNLYAKQIGISSFSNLGYGIPASQIENYVGKEIAKKADLENLSAGESSTISGVDLKVGGEGMKGFYDNMLPKEIGKYVGKMGGKVEKNKIEAQPSDVAPELNEFTDIDFDIFGGAEGFPSGDNPLIGEVRLHHIDTDKNFTIVADQSGFQIFDENGEYYGLQKEFQTAEEARNWFNENYQDGSFHIELNNQNRGEYFTEPQQQDFDYWKVDITPEMAATVSKGQPQYLPYVPYSLPRDPRKIMADFYLLTTTGDKAGYFGQNWEKIKGGMPPTRAGLRYGEYGENLEEAVGKLTEQMKRHMSDSLLFSISAELRHALERSQPEELMNNPFMKAYREYLESYSRLKDVRMTPLIEKNLQGIYPEGKRARITKGSPQEYQISNKAVRKALEETGTSLQDFSEIAENIFRKGRWATSYGGQPWGNIAEGLRMIVNAETTGDMVKAMDNAYDLQHNTATVFNKIKKYQREGGYKWLQDMLDFKYHAMTPRELVPLASSAAKRIAAPALLDIGDPAMDKSRENAVSASSEELVSGLESAIGRLKGNQENVYNDIWVKAQKGSGKDINEELFKWLRAQMPARKDELEAVGVNKDIIRYARLLLAEKMAPKMEVPSDIKEMVAQSIREQKQKAQEKPAPKTEIAQQTSLKWVNKVYKGDEYEIFENGDQPISTETTVYIDGKPIKAGFVADGNGLYLILNNGEEYGVPFDPESAKNAKESFEMEYSGKSNDIAKELKNFHGVNLSFVDPAKAKQTGKTTFEPSPKTEIAKQPKLDWQDNIPNSDDAYADYPNGDKPSGATVNVWVDGSPKKAFIVVHHDGTSIIIDNIRYAVPWGSLDESVADSKKGLADQISGKYNDIVSDLKEYEDLNLSFVDPAKTKQADKTPDIEDFWPKALSFMSLPEIEHVKQTIKDSLEAGKNYNNWIDELEMYGQKAKNLYSPDSQKELKKLFEEEAKKLHKSLNPRLSIKKAESYFNKSITDYANSYWKEVIDQNKNYADEVGVLVESLLAQHSNKPEFSAKRKTISIGRRTYTAYTPVKGGDVYILYGTPNNSGEDLNYKWDGAATFTTKNKMKDDVLDDLEWWFKGEIDYYDPQI